MYGIDITIAHITSFCKILYLMKTRVPHILSGERKKLLPKFQKATKAFRQVSKKKHCLYSTKNFYAKIAELFADRVTSNVNTTVSVSLQMSISKYTQLQNVGHVHRKC